jgi:hypothetical protein
VYKLQSLSSESAGIAVACFAGSKGACLTCSRLLTEFAKTADYLVHLYQETVLSTHIVDNNVDRAANNRGQARCDGHFINLIIF